MQQKVERMLQNIKGGPKFLKELKEFDNLVKAIGECKSKAEEDRIIAQELEVLKQRLADPKLDKSRGREYMVRLIYCEMLGHDASFAYIKALQFASDSNIHTKKAAYLALTQLLDHNSNLVLLLVNTLLSDLKSDNFINVCSALTVTTRLIGGDLVNAVFPVVLERLRHPKEHVRKKAVMALHWFHTLDPRREGPLAGVDLDRHFRTMLCDKDPSVMSAALCALYDCVKQDPRAYRNLVPSFTSILKQVSEHRLPKTYDYHRFPAPFIQIKLLKILGCVGQGDKASSENMYAVLHQTLRRANTSHTIGNALIFECVRTITTIYPNPQLLAAAAESIATFLKSTSHNLRYVGIDALAGIVKINPAYANEHQVAVLDCLEDPDDTLKLKTLELLAKMTKAHNVEVIVDKMMGYLRTSSDEHVRRDIVRKVSDLAERYAPNPSWFIHTVSQVFLLGGEHVEEALAHNLCRLLAEQDEALHRSAVAAYLELLDKPKLPQLLMRFLGHRIIAGRRTPLEPSGVICWVLGEYGHMAPLPPAAVAQRMLTLLQSNRMTDMVRAYLLTGLTKLAAHTGLGMAGMPAEGQEAVRRAASSQNLELQQRAHELQALLCASPAVQSAALPIDASCEEFTEANMAEVAGLPFLSGYVARAMSQGAAPYLSAEERHAARGGQAKSSLRFEAYEPAPAAPASMAPGSSSYDPYGGDMRHGAGQPQHQQSLYAPTAAVSSSSVAAVASSASAYSNEPQLQAAKAGGARRWGPAQFGSGPDLAEQASTSRPSAGMQQQQQRPTGGHSRSSSYGTPAGLAPERERLAASIFGGGAGAPAAGHSQPAAGIRQAPVAQQLPARPSPHQPSPQRPQQPSAMELLLDLDAPAPPAPPPMASSGYGGGMGQQGAHTGDLLGGLHFSPVAPAAGAVTMPNSSGGVNGLDSLLLGGAPLGPGAGMMGGAGYPIVQPQQQVGMPFMQQQQLGSPAMYPAGGSMGGMPGAGYGSMPPTSGMGIAVAPAQMMGMHHQQHAMRPAMMAGGAQPAGHPPHKPAAAAADPFSDLLG